MVIDAVNERLRPHRQRRAELTADPGYLDEVLARGNARANEVADETLERVREAMGMAYLHGRQRIPYAAAQHRYAARSWTRFALPFSGSATRPTQR